MDEKHNLNENLDINNKKEDDINKENIKIENENNENNDPNNDLQENFTVLSRKVRIYIFFLFLILSVVVDLENGIFSSSVDYLQEDLNMNNAEYGIFVSVPFTGRIIGLVIYMILLNFKHRKYTLLASIFLHGSTYGLYKITNNYYILTFANMFTAGNKACSTVYRPVWIEQFGLSKFKSIFFSLVQIMSSYGQIIGFNLGSLIFKENWRLALLSVLFMMYIIGFGFLVCPNKYFFRKYMFYEGKLVDIDDEETENNSEISNNNEKETNDFDENIRKSNKDFNPKSELKGSVFVLDIKKEDKIKIKKTFCQKIKDILKEIFSLIKNIIYLLSVIKRANTTFILQVIFSYVKVYQKRAIENSDEDLIVLFYSISTLASTAVGGLLGGIITKKLGGYESKKSLYVIIIPEIITAISMFFLAFTEDFYTYNINLIIFFCFISSGAPVVQGYLIKTIPKSIKGIGVGLDIIISTFLGKIPGPVIYGALADSYDDSIAWRVCMSYYYVGVLTIFLLCFFKCREKVIDTGEIQEVSLKHSINSIAEITSGPNYHDIFPMKKMIPKRRFIKSVNSMIYQYNFNDDPARNTYLSSIMEKSERPSIADNNVMKNLAKSANNEIKKDNDFEGEVENSLV